MTFRGLTAPPYDDATFNFSHTQPARGYPNIDGASHDWQGMEPENLRFRLYFLNTVGAGILFPDVWNQWWAALKDGRPGEMEHPVLGPIDAVVKEGTVALTAQVTSGVIVDVTFERTILDPEAIAQDFKVQLSPKEIARHADLTADLAGVPFPPENTETSFAEMVTQLDGFLFAIENQALGTVNRVKNTINTMTDFIDKRDPRQTAQIARDALVDLWIAMDDLGTTIGQKLRPIAFETLAADTSLDAFARVHKNELAEVIELNPLALLAPQVSKGTVLQYYAA